MALLFRSWLESRIRSDSGLAEWYASWQSELIPMSQPRAAQAAIHGREHPQRMTTKYDEERCSLPPRDTTAPS